MAMELTFEDADGYLLARPSGEWEPEAVTQVVKQIAAAAQKGEYTRVIVDGCDVSAPKTDFYRFQMGQDVAAFFPPGIKIAAVYPDALINRFMETTAVNRGAHVAVFSDLEEARQWLLGEDG